MNDIKISVIIPIYNTEKFLEETLDSVLNQTMIEDIEVLMLDDGSTDNSKYIIDKYAAEHDNFYAFHNKNMGSGCERNFGIKHAKGEYIHFLDSDDYIIPTAYEKLYELAKSDDYDFVMANATKFTENSNWKDVLYINTFRNIHEKITSTNIKEMPNLAYNACCWDKIIKRDFLLENDIYFPEMNVITQDIPFMIKLHCLAKSVGILDEYLFYWRHRPDSTSQTQQKSKIKNFNDRITVLNIMDEFMEKNSVDETIKEEAYLKRLNLDLRYYIIKINDYSPENQKIIMEKTSAMLKKIPEETMLKLNSYRQIIYRMIENKDMESLRDFATKEPYFKLNPEEIYNEIDEEYKDLIDIERDFIEEDLTANLKEVSIDEQNLNIYIKAHVPYLTNAEDEIEIKLFDTTNNKDYELINSLNNDNNLKANPLKPKLEETFHACEDKVYKFNIPYEEIKDLNGRYVISVLYKNKDFEHAKLLKISKRMQVFNIENMEIFSKFGFNRIYNLIITPDNGKSIKLKKIEILDNNENNIVPNFNKNINMFFESDSKIDSLILENIIYYDKIDYRTINLIENEDQCEFQLSIPFNDIFSLPIKKWEIKTKDNVRINIDEEYVYRDDKIKVNVKKKGNRTFIVCGYYHKLTEIEKLEKILKKERVKNKKLTDKNKKLKEKNKKLKEKNKKLTNVIYQYKSRKVIKIANKLHR